MNPLELLEKVDAIFEAKLRAARQEAAALIWAEADANKVGPETSTLMEGLRSLTPREKEVVTLLLEGMGNPEIGDRLCISDTTVRHHLTVIYDKVGIHGRLKLCIRLLNLQINCRESFLDVVAGGQPE